MCWLMSVRNAPMLKHTPAVILAGGKRNSFGTADARPG